MPAQNDHSTEPSQEDDGAKDWEAWRAMTLEAYERFHAVLEQHRTEHPGLTRYIAVDRAETTRGTSAWWWGASSEVRETINSINAWGVRLHEWAAWNQVLDSYSDRNERWDVLNHFVEPMAFFCMLQPSSFADRLSLAAETLLHQANRRVSPDEPDRLDQDARPGKPLRRSDRRRQLNRLGKGWKCFSSFQQALHALDGHEYRRLTHNFRDLASHSFSPRFMLGQINRAIRSIGPYHELQLQPDGCYKQVDHPTRKVVSYAMSSLEPLPLDAAHEANLAEYRRARNAIECFAKLIDELCDWMDKTPNAEGS